MYRDSFLVNKIKKSLPIPIFENTDIPMCIVDSDGIMVTINKAFIELTRFGREELTSKSLSIIYNEEDHYKAQLNHDEFILKDTYDKRSSILSSKENLKLDVEETSIKFIDEDFVPYRLISFMENNNNNKSSGDYIKSILFKVSQIVNKNESTGHLFEEIHSLISHIMPADNFVIALKDYNSGRVEIPFNSFAKYLIDSNSFNTSLSDLIDYLLTREYAELLDKKQLRELINEHKIGRLDKLPQLLLSVPIKIQNKTIGIILLQNFTDPNAYDENKKQIIDFISEQLSRVIERKRYEAELIEAKRKAEESDQTKSNFLSQMSHEIRTPLNSILSFTSLIKEEMLPYLNENTMDYFEIVQRGGNRLLRTFDLILNIAGIQKDEYVAEFTDLSLVEDLIEPIVNRYQVIANKKNIELSLIENVKNPIIKSDFCSLNQLLVNLIENAVKFTNKGKVEIITGYNAENKLQVEIKDTGVGINPDFLPRIFENFSQEEIGYTRKFEGNGLGLALVKAYADINNLVIKVDSKKLKGTNFTIIFP